MSAEVHSSDLAFPADNVQLSQLEHVLLRPDTYIGSVEHHREKLWVYDSVNKHMAYRCVTTG